MCGRAAHDEDRFAGERKLPHRVIDLFRDRLGPGAPVEPRQLVEHEPEFPVIGIQRLHRPRPGKHDERCVRTVQAGFGDELRELVAENFDFEGIEKQIPGLVETTVKPFDAEE